MNLSDYIWYRSLRGGYWINRPPHGWHKVMRRDYNNARAKPNLYSLQGFEDHHDMDGVFPLVVVCSIIFVVMLPWILS